MTDEKKGVIHVGKLKHAHIEKVEGKYNVVCSNTFITLEFEFNTRDGALCWARSKGYDINSKGWIENYFNNKEKQVCD